MQLINQTIFHQADQHFLLYAVSSIFSSIGNDNYLLNATKDPLIVLNFAIFVAWAKLS